ncbi:MAG TPA: AzlD domain-containing protein [Humidesulfovibrio sp.]|uniref:AzlD family protein n=1 Tax=Humidesulfovibrio sp. TaxID=2910988 RepID=UPI002CA751EB|nr:AzlD domain-containing protein [Humidesulfovibrio sp.]HWR04500.1 AzlD domain-containing protein [Humidesulfovibrio sp.]
MDAQSTSLLTITGMAVATYASRAAGLMLMSRLSPGPRLTRFMQAIPGAILASIVAPSALTSGPAEAAATAVTGLVAWRFGNLPLAMAVGVGVVLGLRQFVG